MSNPTELTGCRGGCKANETTCHILQACPIAHEIRVERHNSVASRIAAHCKKKGWTTFEELHIRHQDGTLFKHDIVAFTSPDTAVVCDAQVSWETSEPIPEVWDRKRGVYDNEKFREAALQKWPDVNLSFLPCILGDRGIWPACNAATAESLQLRSVDTQPLPWGFVLSARRDPGKVCLFIYFFSKFNAHFELRN
ncbi:hypothetical protein Zmor_004005 [Zophobas morio]|uniref:Reverse transcriptase n=1 Tax=Zophobas morio TaxID=2755281 RepID=A0AA38HPQ6_9CUCU|nr:hypothetical protein Zmor_004005 [Zophobas morio]